MKRSRTMNRLVVAFVALAALCELAAWPYQWTTAAAPPQRTETILPSRGRAVPAEKETILTTLEQTPLLFVENRGQLDARVAYYIHGRDTSLYFTPQGITLSLTSRTSVRPSRETPGEHMSAGIPLGFSNDAAGLQRWTVKLNFVNANPHVRLRGEKAAHVATSYFKGPTNRWQTGLSSYASLVYENLWPGIDLVYRGSVNRLKYQFVVRPGADPNQIRLAYRGTSSLNVNKHRQLDVITPVRSFQDDAPYSYQEVNGHQVEVMTNYAIDSATSTGQVYGFRVDRYDTRRSLVIDPEMIIYAGYIGGVGDERGLGIAVDDTGAAYVTGATSSSQATFPVTEGLDASFSGVQDAFVVKVNPAGTGIVYAAYIGGTGDDVGFDIAVDHDGNAYITGATTSNETSFPVVTGPDLSHNGGTYDGFVAKLNAAGTALAYSGYLGGVGEDGGAAIAVDSRGAAFIAGGTNSNESTFPVSIGPDLTYNGGMFFGDAFVAKVNPSGLGLNNCGYIGGAGDDLALAIAIDRDGNMFVAGGTTSNESSFPVKTGPDVTFNGGFRDAFIAKIQSDGSSLVYAGYVGGASGDTAFGVAVDDAGNPYISGETSSAETSFPVVVGPDLTYNGGGDAFVAKLNFAGTAIIYCGYIGGAGRDGSTDIRVNANGRAYLTGGTGSSETSFPVTGGPSLSFRGQRDAFIATVGNSGAALDYCGYVGGDADDISYALALDRGGNAYVTGETSSTQNTFPNVVGPDLTYNGGPYDAFVAKIHTPNLSPDCHNARPSLAELWPPNHQQVSVSVLGVNDPDGDAVSIRIDRIMQDEPTENTGDGYVCPDAYISPNGATGLIIAEREGSGNGRVYAIYFTATDDRGGSCQGSIKVSVPPSQGRSAIDDGPRYDSTACGARPESARLDH